MKNNKRILCFIVAIFFSMITTLTTKDATAAENNVIVFAAASTTNAITEIGELYESHGLGRIKTSFASSSTLAKQIQSGAPADVYLSANKNWMDFLEKKGAVKKESRFDLLSNRIVLIVPFKSPVKIIDIKKGLDIIPFLGSNGRLSLGDPDHVPAGMYSKTALKSLGMWEQVKDRLAPMKDVRAALVFVERGEVPLGLVYTTDAAISRKARIIGTFPSDSHPPIVYPVAIISNGKAESGTVFLNFLKTPKARAIFIKYGFEVR